MWVLGGQLCAAPTDTPGGTACDISSSHTSTAPLTRGRAGNIRTRLHPSVLGPVVLGAPINAYFCLQFDYLQTCLTPAPSSALSSMRASRACPCFHYSAPGNVTDTEGVRGK